MIGISADIIEVLIPPCAKKGVVLCDFRSWAKEKITTENTEEEKHEPVPKARTKMIESRGSRGNPF